MGENDGITYIPQTLASYDYAYAFLKTDFGNTLCDEMSEYLRRIKADGTPEQIFDHPEKENTRRFIRRLKVLELEIPNRDYDFLGMTGQISEYSREEDSDLPNRMVLHVRSEETKSF